MIAIGGEVDAVFFQSSTPEEIAMNYQSLVQLPLMVPYWSLGWHQCRWGYKALEDVKYVLGNYTEHGFPLDTIWNDIDYMQDYRDFTYDSKRYNGLDNFVKNDVHGTHRHYVPIMDAGVAARTYSTFGAGVYDSYQKGLDQDAFIRDYTNERAMIG